MAGSRKAVATKARKRSPAEGQRRSKTAARPSRTAQSLLHRLRQDRTTPLKAARLALGYPGSPVRRPPRPHIARNVETLACKPVPNLDGSTTDLVADHIPLRSASFPAASDHDLSGPPTGGIGRGLATTSPKASRRCGNRHTARAAPVRSATNKPMSSAMSAITAKSRRYFNRDATPGTSWSSISVQATAGVKPRASLGPRRTGHAFPLAEFEGEAGQARREIRHARQIRRARRERKGDQAPAPKRSRPRRQNGEAQRGPEPTSPTIRTHHPLVILRASGAFLFSPENSVLRKHI